VPTIPTRTAQGRGAVLNVPEVSPNAYGAEGFAGVKQLGQSLMALDAKLQAQRDEVDLVGKAGDYNIRLAQLPDEILADTTLDTTSKRVAAMKLRADEYRQELNKDASPGVQRALSIHAAQTLSRGIIHLETEDRKRQVHQVRADSAALQDRLADREAMQIANGNGEAAMATRLERQALLARSVERGIHSPQEAAAEHSRAQNRTWESVAQQNPEYLLKLSDEVLMGGAPPAGMDAQQLHHYVNIAVGTMHASQLQSDRILKLQEAEVKRVQDENARSLTADILEGNPIGNAIPTLLRSRGLDDGVGRTLHDLQKKLLSEPDLTNYQKELAPQIEASLGALKYSNTGLADSLEQGLVSDFVQGHILKEEFTHLMGVLRSVQDYKHQGGKEDHNANVTHAHSVLKQDLATTGPADKFDALAGQTLKEADEFFWRRMQQNPEGDPWKVAKEASDIFKPVIEKRLGLSKTDKGALDDAKMLGFKHSKAISPAAYQAYKDKDQQDKGWAIVQEAIKNLPPPPAPGFFDRLKGLLPEKKATPQAKPKARKAPGVMGGE